MSDTDKYMLEVNDLRTYFPVKKGLFRRTIGYVKAVDGVSFKIEKGQTLGLVGESGCGKTTAARSIIRLIQATSGKVIFDGTDVFSADKQSLKQIRKDMSIVFQDPYGSLNPRMTVGDIIADPLKVNKKLSSSQLTEKVIDLLRKVGLSEIYMNRYPHEFSGGQRQRVGLARALALEPKLVICDEPVSALDVSIQSQILNLLKDMQDELGLTYLFIAHDLAVVEFLCDIVAVMYMGQIVEKATSEQLYKKPLHPYTRLLMSAIPKVDTSARYAKKSKIKGELTDRGQLPKGCSFAPRCPLAEGICIQKKPDLEEKQPEHTVACWKCQKMLDLNGEI
ncbi:MAG: ATP-binding cassette domain-containing protein [Planctomycetes bacterium]|nr:ATP-binding cassette domain-containing protein [Planctomycetota bacterium]